MPPSYVELHCHSHFSLLEGASSPEELLERALKLGYPALALTDHDGLYGSMAFAQLAAQLGIKPITGAELSLDNGSHLTLLAETGEGYARLSRLISIAHLDNAKGEPSLEIEKLDLNCTAPNSRPAGLIALAGRCSEIGRMLDAGHFHEARLLAERYRDRFGAGNFFLELQQNLVRGDTRRNRLLIQLGEDLGIACVATNDVHYHVRERHRLQDVLVAIKHRSTLIESHRHRRANGEFYLKSAREMAALFPDCPQALHASVEIADRCRFNLTSDLNYEFPHTDTEGLSADEALEQLCRRELERRYGPPNEMLKAKAEERLQEELRLVRKHRLSGFLLVYHDILELAQEVACELRGVDPKQTAHLPNPGRGRGSSVSSLVCYLIGLSHIDPVKNNLFVARFLNDDLNNVPDIDLDFPRDIRAELIKRVYAKFGKEHAALVCTFPTYRIRSAIREIGKVLDLPPVELDRLAKLSEGGSATSLAQEIEAIPSFRAKKHAGAWRHLVDLAYQIAGFPRHVSQHVGGMVISSQPLVEMVPIENARMEGRYVCQWDKDSIDDARFIKIDFLALGMLSAVDDCLDIIAHTSGHKPDLSRINFEDEAIYRMICEADTIGLFQIESRAQIASLPSTQPRNLDDLAVQVAIIRPGPIIGGAFKPYQAYRRKLNNIDQPGDDELYPDGVPKPDYPHPILEPVLRRTAGVILFQEQILQAAMVMADFSAGEAERLRRGLGRKNAREEVTKLQGKLYERAKAKGIDDDAINRVFKMFLGFAEFGFPESHAHAFALLAYQSAWLRYYYPAEFFAALLNNQPMGFYPPHVLVHYVRRSGVLCLRPSLNHGAARCSVEDTPFDLSAPRSALNTQRPATTALDSVMPKAVEEPQPHYSLQGETTSAIARDLSARRSTVLVEKASRNSEPYPAPSFPSSKAIRIGFGYVRGVGEDLAASLERERLSNGPFTDLDDLQRRTLLKREAIEGLIAVGAMDDLNPDRRELLWQMGNLIKPVAGQLTLSMPAGDATPDLPPLTEWEQMTADYGLLSLSTEYHPMQLIRPELGEDLLSSVHLSTAREDTVLSVVGLVTTRQRPASAKGIVFITMEDEFGKMDLVIYRHVYQHYRSLVRGEAFLIARGKVQQRDGATHLLVQKLERLPIDSATLTPSAHDMLPPPSNNFGGGHGGGRR